MLLFLCFAKQQPISRPDHRERHGGRGECMSRRAHGQVRRGQVLSKQQLALAAVRTWARALSRHPMPPRINRSVSTPKHGDGALCRLCSWRTPRSDEQPTKSENVDRTLWRACPHSVDGMGPRRRGMEGRAARRVRAHSAGCSPPHYNSIRSPHK
jgi:hypothetical protein